MSIENSMSRREFLEGIGSLLASRSAQALIPSVLVQEVTISQQTESETQDSQDSEANNNSDVVSRILLTGGIGYGFARIIKDLIEVRAERARSWKRGKEVMNELAREIGTIEREHDLPTENHPFKDFIEEELYIPPEE